MIVKYVVCLFCTCKVAARERRLLVRVLVLVRAGKVSTHERWSLARVVFVFGCMRGMQSNEPHGVYARWWPTSGCHQGTTLM